ncbi:flagellar biosynthesis protein FliQ [Fodinisporobacter ferrooxydans]|uniref:Flagellar biosynthetic protein FliQ n=1 Tax=Fodinisporobacter ferrooxydans TaxID=2901836 RepID=A0ABY4CQX0_9BACL|nr:flagellar biosynthesis protein FliQ [Alicyclobacillaceae bacterium MYW30-H2]
MGEELIFKIGEDTLMTVLKVSAPILVFGLVVGLLVSVFQAATQINEQTLSFIPRILAIFLAMLLFGPWMLHVMLDFTRGILNNLSSFIY